MTNPVMNFLALALYLSAAGLLGLRLARGEVVTGSAKIGILSLGLGAVVLHATLLYTRLWHKYGLNLALTQAFSLVACVIAILHLATSHQFHHWISSQAQPHTMRSSAGDRFRPLQDYVKIYSTPVCGACRCQPTKVSMRPLSAG